MKKRDDIDKKIRAMERVIREDPRRYEPRPTPPLYSAATPEQYAAHAHTVQLSNSPHQHTFNPASSTLTVSSTSATTGAVWTAGGNTSSVGLQSYNITNP
jgi:hypothetical protein